VCVSKHRRLSKGKGEVWGLILGYSIVGRTNGDFATRLFPNYFEQDLFSLWLA